MLVKVLQQKDFAMPIRLSVAVIGTRTEKGLVMMSVEWLMRKLVRRKQVAVVGQGVAAM